MAERPPESRPDGLIIADEHLVPNTTAGLLSANIHVPESMEVVAYANFPLPSQSHVPALRRGFDAHTMLMAATEIGVNDFP